MAKRKVSHHTRIVSKKQMSIGSVQPGSIIEFRYSGEDIYDTKPLVFVLFSKGKILTGINIGYMKEYKVRRLLEETNFKKLKYYSLYEDSFRTYSISKIKMVKLVEYETKQEQRKDNKKEVKDTLDKLDENKL